MIDRYIKNLSFLKVQKLLESKKNVLLILFPVFGSVLNTQ